MGPRLKFAIAETEHIASRYQYGQDETVLTRLRPTVLARGYLLKEELAMLARWKAPRSAGHVQDNTDDYVEEVTRFALSAMTERARVQLLTNLDGVLFPTASVILHFFHKDPYPIIDIRALWSVSLDAPASTQYKFDFWWSYVEFCRKAAKDAGVDMRTLDRALWQFSKENQPKS